MKLMETKVYQFGFVVYDYLMLNFIITLFSIPVVTLVPAVVAGARCHGKGEFKFKDYLGNFKTNYLNLTFLSNLYLSVIVLIGFYTIKNFQAGQNTLILAALVFLLIELILAFLQLFNENICYEANLGIMIKNSFIYGNVYFLQSLIVVALIVVYAYLTSFITTLALFIFSFFILIYSKFMKLNNKKIK